MVKPAEGKIGIDVLRKQSQRGDAHAVFDHHHQNTGENENSFFPELLDGEMSDEHRENH